MDLTKSLARVALVTALILLIPLVAMRFTTEVNWTFSDFVFAGIVLFATGLAYVLVASRWDSTTYRLAVGVAVAAGLLLVWVNAAVGLIGSEHNPANLLYGGVLAVALVGAIGARFRPMGMSRAMFAAALAYVAVTVTALCVWTPTGAAAEPAAHMTNVVVANALFATLWAVSGWLFRRAAIAADSHSARQLVS